MPWPIGKDSNIVIWLARNPFFGKIPSRIAHRNDLRISLDAGIGQSNINPNLIVEISTEAREHGISYETQNDRIDGSATGVDESVTKILEQYCHA